MIKMIIECGKKKKNWFFDIF